jgi:MoaA/NifB/PqqE/SkfB family radical SAM enzyme
MSLDLFKKCSDDCKDRYLILNGGEPFLHPQILDFLRYRLETSPTKFVTVITNGSKVSDIMLNDLNNLAMSLDACIEIKHSCNYELDRHYKGHLLENIARISNYVKTTKHLRLLVNFIKNNNNIKMEDLLGIGLERKQIVITPLLNGSILDGPALSSEYIKNIRNNGVNDREYYEIDGTKNFNVIDNILYLNNWRKNVL